jgi:hypothetical protein
VLSLKPNIVTGNCQIKIHEFLKPLRH